MKTIKHCFSVPGDILTWVAMISSIPPFFLTGNGLYHLMSVIRLTHTDDDVFFKPLNQGYEGYIAKEIPGGYGKQDIYRIEIFSDDHPRKFFVRGMVKVADLINNMNDSVKVSAMNIKNPNQTIIVYSNPKTGEYEFQLPQGRLSDYI